MTHPTYVEFVERVLVGYRMTTAQRATARVVFDRVQPKDLRGEERRAARVVFGDVDKFPTLAWMAFLGFFGRDSGKSLFFEALYSLWRMFVADLSSLAPGERAGALIMAPDLRTARHDHSLALGAARSSPALAPLIGSVTADSFELRRPDGTVGLDCLPASRGGSSIRGRGWVSAVYSEPSFFQDADHVVNFRDCWDAAGPRILPGGMRIAVGTPWTEADPVAVMWKKNVGHPEFAIAGRAPTAFMRGEDPRIVETIAAERLADPETTARERDCEFGSGEANLLDHADVDASVRSGDAETPAPPGTPTAASGDLATRNDYCTLQIGCRRVIERGAAPPLDQMFVNLALDWRPTFIGRVLKQAIDVEQLEVEFASHLRRYGGPLLALDSWGYDFFSARMQSRGIRTVLEPMHLAAQAPRASLLASLFKQGRVSLPDNPELVKQLKSLRVFRSPGGQMRFSAPNTRGAHDDHAKALMLLAPRVMALSPSGGVGLIRLDAPIAFAGGRIIVGRRKWVRDLADGTVIEVPPPVGSREHRLAEAQRHARGIFTPAEASSGRSIDDFRSEAMRVLAELEG